jgi:hypothetical protein
MLLGATGGTVNAPYMTCRRVAGQLRFLFMDASSNGAMRNDAGAAHIYEVIYPGYNAVIANAPPCSVLYDYGFGYYDHALDVFGTHGSGSNLWPSSMTWDNRNNCLWFQYADIYGNNNNPFLIRGDINDTTHTISWSGPWRFAGTASNSTATASAKQCGGYLVSVPQSYGDRYLGGATIACGAGASSVDAALAFSPVLWAATGTPTSSTPPTVPNGGPDFPATCLLGGDMAHRGLRPGDYLDVACGGTGVGSIDPTSPSRTALTGRINTSQGPEGVLWFDWSGVRGVIFSLVLMRGHNWYGTQLNNETCRHGKVSDGHITGPVTLIDPIGDAGQVYGQGFNWEHIFYIYDPLTFVPVAGGNIFGVPIIEARYTYDQFPNFAFYKHADNSSFNAVGGSGLCADETSRLMFVPQAFPSGGDPGYRGLGLYVNVFSVAP